MSARNKKRRGSANSAAALAATRELK